MLKIGFGHKSGHGKDTFCKHLVTHLNCKAPDIKVKHINLADKLKDIAFQMYGWAGLERKIYYENNRPERHEFIEPLGRTALQIWIDLGQKLREQDEKVWLNYLAEHNHNCDILVCGDVRHYNEADIMDQVYKVTNPRITDLQIKNIDHVLDDYTGWHGEFINDRDFKKVDQLMEGLANKLIRGFK